MRDSEHSSATSKPADRVNAKNVLVCGATGFIGRNITERLCQRPDLRVHGVRFKRPEYDAPNVIWHQADLRNPAEVDRLVDGMDIVIQAAATTSGAKDIVARPYVHVTDNAVMNSHLLRAAFDHKISHFVFFSCTVMYQSSDSPVKECDFDSNEPLNSRYFGVGHTKLYVERLCEFFSSISEMKSTVIRHSNIYGPHDKFDLERSHVFGATVTKVMTADHRVSVWGNGKEARDLLYVDDLVSFVETAIANQSDRFRLYNCGYSKAISVHDLVKQIIAASGRSLRIEFDTSRPTIKTSLCLDSSRARDELGWQPATTWENGIEQTLRWWSKHVGPNAE